MKLLISLPKFCYSLPERKFYRLDENSPERRVFFRLSENTFAWARIPPRLGERFLV